MWKKEVERNHVKRKQGCSRRVEKKKKGIKKELGVGRKEGNKEEQKHRQKKKKRK